MAALRETEETFFKESDFTRWFEYIRARLPGAQGEDAAVDRGSSGDDPDDIDDSDEQAGAPGIESNGKKRTGHKWTPSQGEGRRFINLVSKYITSLNNDEYMQIASIHHKATYYTVFQRITWLLLEHGVIDTARFIDLVCQINAGFFGLPSDDPPILCPRLRTHLRSVWYQEWEAYDMSAHVLASLYIVNLLVSGIDDEALPAQLEQQAAWVLAGLTSIVGPPKFTQSNDAYSRLAEWYHEDEIDLILQTEQNYNTRLANINQILNRWSQRVTIALENTKDELLRKLLLQARVDYGRARYYALDLLQNLQEQTNLCSNLILWTRFAGDEEGSKQYRERLILLLQAQGFSHGAAEKLFEQGVNLFLSSEHKEAATKLHQALILAEQTNDAVLLKKCNQYLGYTKFFLK
jgi:hypothetical protein